MSTSEWFVDAASFERLTPRLWGPVSAGTLALAAPQPGERVLDACCGAGASAVPAALAVAPGGWVDAVDTSVALLAAGRRRAEDEGATTVTFVHQDAATFGESAAYDLLMCVLGVFFLPAPTDAGRHLVTRLRPGGRAAITTWRSGALAPVLAALARAATGERGRPADPDPRALATHRASEQLSTAEGLGAFATEVGLSDAVITEVPLRVPVDERLVADLLDGTAASLAVADLPPSGVARVRRRVAEELAGAEVDATTLVLTGHRRPASP